MQSGKPDTLLASMRRRRFLLTAWPWRSLAYLLTAVPPALGAALTLTTLVFPWVLALVYANDSSDRLSPPWHVVMILLGAVLVFGLMPLLTLPLATLERWRLRMVDPRPVASGHRRPQTVGLWSWMRTRYTEAATWREVGYVLLLVTAVPVLCSVAALAMLLVGALITSPLVMRAGVGPMVLGLSELTTDAQAWPYALGGLALIPVVGYVLAATAGAHGALARALLHGTSRDALLADLVEVSRSRARLADAFEAERRRIERDLHDGAQRRLVSLTLQLALARLDAPPDSPVATALTDAHDQAKQVMADLRQLIRGIYPRVLVDRGLRAALRELADEAAIPVTVSADLRGTLPDHVEATAYFVVAEALTNIAKHSGATAASVTANRQSEVLVVEVSDNGHGDADPQRGTGLTGLADRVAVIDGKMLLSSPAGGPTLLRVELPCPLIDQPSE